MLANNDKNKYEEYGKKCNEYNKAILFSGCAKKVIVSGPGTGKSFLFQMICEGIRENEGNKILVLSFINELVDDLARDLYKYKTAEVRTLHSFALSQFPKETNKFFLNIESIIEEDYKIINGKEIKFKKTLCNLINDPDALDFYSKRRKYYGFFGPNCSVYALVKQFENNKDKIPEYSQILIDEFQDFNKLEATLIKLLAEKSPVLIVGDDDQSLYAFKYANPDEIRLMNKLQEYTSFELPFCRRCPEVIINSFHSVVNKAKEKGYLGKRVDKRFEYFPSEEKDKISNENPKIIVKKQIHQIAVAYNIEKEINNIFNPKEKDVSILVICSLKKQIPDLEKRLREKGFDNIQTTKENEREELVEGFSLLLKDKESNLGWRIVSKYILNDKLCNVVKESHLKKEQVKFKDLLCAEDKKKIEIVLTILRKIINNKETSKEESEKIINCFGYNPNQIVIQKIRNKLDRSKFPKRVNKNIPIKITTILGAKGFTSDYVFLVNFDDKYILEKGGKITDENICKFLVALTRARRRIYIYTSQTKLPTFVNWIDKDYIQLEN
ncbi:MAG: AAA family ATPase [Candidatus Pacebacteria bacterium]|nr:AAA family ATPase [Candidatus Paceibacterota bacterium]